MFDNILHVKMGRSRLPKGHRPTTCTFQWRRDCVLLILLLVFLSIPVDAVPDGFIVESVTKTLPYRGLTGKFAPNPRNGNKPMLVLLAKEGNIVVLEDPDNSPESMTVLNLGHPGRMCTNFERGLQGIAFHPNFEVNHFVYLFYTKFREGCYVGRGLDDGPWNVIERFIMDSETLRLDYDSREEIWRYTGRMAVLLNPCLFCSVHLRGLVPFLRLTLVYPLSASTCLTPGELRSKDGGILAVPWNLEMMVIFMSRLGMMMIS
jgi:Glucose / Sorbosone dehydrogenase